MADENWTVQVSPKVGDILVNVRGNDPTEVLQQLSKVLAGLDEMGLGKVRTVVQSSPPAQASASNAPWVTPTHDQAVQTVQTNLGGTPVTGNGPPHPPMPDTGPDGALHPFKNCPVCSAPLKIQDKLTKAGDRWYRKLECSQDYKHTKDKQYDQLVWSEDYKKRR